MAAMVWEHAAMLCHTYVACLTGSVLVRTAAVRSMDMAISVLKLFVCMLLKKD